MRSLFRLLSGFGRQQQQQIVDRQVPRVSVVIPSETMETKKMGRKGQERERSSSLFRSRGSPNQTANGTAERAVRERIRTPKKRREVSHAYVSRPYIY